MDPSLDSLRFPIGRFAWPESVSADELRSAINSIALFPEKLALAVEDLDDEQLDTPYRPEGWTVRQVVHHCADSHMNAIIRFRWALTEDTPMIKAYNEADWAKLPDYQLPPAVSLLLLTGMHARWTDLMQKMSASDWKREFAHPEWKVMHRLEQVAMLYSWHGDHHKSHILSLRERMKW